MRRDTFLCSYVRRDNGILFGRQRQYESSFFFLNFTLFYFTILYWFCHTSSWIHHGCTWVPNPEPPSHLLPRIISLDHPHAPAPSILYPVSNTDWRFLSYMIVHMFQCHSPKSSHPLPLPEYPWDFPRTNTRVGCHFLLHGTVPIQGLNPVSPAAPGLAGRFFTTAPPGEPIPNTI